jgi:pimeloyl-ACP methyl ester carboxylesterase
MAPVPIQLSNDYTMAAVHVDAMREINSLKLKKQKEADEILKTYEPDLLVRQFLLTNLKKNLKNDGIYEFRIPFDILGESIDKMGEFFQSEPIKTFAGPTLFITGDKSPYRKQFIEQPALIKAQFPNSRIENIQDAGHWGNYSISRGIIYAMY